MMSLVSAAYLLVVSFDFHIPSDETVQDLLEVDSRKDSRQNRALGTSKAHDVSYLVLFFDGSV